MPNKNSTGPNEGSESEDGGSLQWVGLPHEIKGTKVRSKYISSMCCIHIYIRNVVKFAGRK